jgi:outer membrane immunogenic protein
LVPVVVEAIAIRGRKEGDILIMKRFLFTTVAFGVLALPAMAADMNPAPVYRAPVAVPVIPFFNWTGLYIGGTAGGAWLNGNATAGGTTFCNPTLLGCGANQFSNALAAALPASFNNKPAGFIGGGEIGYNWQAGQWVYGLETDISGASISGSSSFSGSATPVGFPANTVNVSATASEKLNYLGTVRGRAGFLVTPPVLVYATGGFAYGGINTSASLAESVSGPCACGPAPSVATSTSTTRTGWTVGGGVEWMFAPNWTVKGEYLYYDLGSSTYAFPALVQTTSAGAMGFGANGGTTVEFKGSVARAGVNYKF